MNLERIATGFSGLWAIQPPVFRDARGDFVKTYHRLRFQELGIPFEPAEEFFSISAKDVIRGMHFQLPPKAHAKLVYCLHGKALDVVLDLRKESPTFGRSYATPMSEVDRKMLFIPVGFAHGFLAMEKDTVMVYLTNSVHSPSHDSGIAWNSFGFAWPNVSPIISERDQRLLKWQEFDSPF